MHRLLIGGWVISWKNVLLEIEFDVSKIGPFLPQSYALLTAWESVFLFEISTDWTIVFLIGIPFAQVLRSTASIVLEFETVWVVNCSLLLCRYGLSFKHWAVKWLSLKKHDLQVWVWDAMTDICLNSTFSIQSTFDCQKYRWCIRSSFQMSLRVVVLCCLFLISADERVNVLRHSASSLCYTFWLTGWYLFLSYSKLSFFYVIKESCGLMYMVMKNNFFKHWAGICLFCVLKVLIFSTSASYKVFVLHKDFDWHYGRVLLRFRIVNWANFLSIGL